MIMKVIVSYNTNLRNLTKAQCGTQNGFEPVFDHLRTSAFAFCISTLNNIKRKVHTVFIDTEMQFSFAIFFQKKNNKWCTFNSSAHILRQYAVNWMKEQVFLTRQKLHRDISRECGSSRRTTTKETWGWVLPHMSHVILFTAPLCEL